MHALQPAPQRGLLIVNPKASATSRRRLRKVVKKLGEVIDVSTVHTDERGHAEALARAGADKGYDVILSLGGDGTVNEVVNGILAGGRGPPRPRCSRRSPAGRPTCSRGPWGWPGTAGRRSGRSWRRCGRAGSEP
ncbi:hypothetical protein GCM10029992_63890 [Glycomyces albus]